MATLLYLLGSVGWALLRYVLAAGLSGECVELILISKVNQFIGWIFGPAAHISTLSGAIKIDTLCYSNTSLLSNNI